MDIGEAKQCIVNRCDGGQNTGSPNNRTLVNTEVGLKQRQENKNNKQMPDSDQGGTMDEGLEMEMSEDLNKADDNNDEEFKPCVNMSVEKSQDESDLSDFSEENTACQLANHAVRAKLLSSVANSANGTDSKLRVSVFDHKTIPTRFIMPRKVDRRTTQCSNNGPGANQSVRPQNLGSTDMDNKRKLSSLSYTVLKSGKIYTSDSNKSSPTSPNNDSENDVRTRFDILLRKLIGDVNDMQMETNSTPAPATVSSGYESDYPANKNMDLNKQHSGSNKSLKSDTDKTSGHFGNKNESSDKSNGYISECHSIRFGSGSLHGSQGFSSLPAFPMLQSSSSTGSLKRCDSRDGSLVKVSDRDSQGFNYAQRHNYKLTKVTRNMYEIIHDLQNADKSATDSRKRSRKGRKSSQETGISYNENGHSSAKESRSRNSTNSDILPENENINQLCIKPDSDSVQQAFSGAVVRCVRRPLGTDTLPIQRNASHSESSNRLTSSTVNNNSNKVQNDLRNLLCGTGEMTLSVDDNNIHLRELNTATGGNNMVQQLSSGSGNKFNQTGHSVTNESSLSTGQQRPTLTEQFNTRPKPDDHVYETIPGDEKLYEEWKKMRQNTKIPKIRRFTTIPDLPGTFIPKEPPALPERKYLNSNTPQLKDRDSYIFMGDVNSNFRSKTNLDSEKTSKGDSGYTSVASDKMLDSKLFSCYPNFPADDSAFNNTGRSDETSDGYCSIDNLSVLRENFNDQSPPETVSRDTRFPNSGTFPRLPQPKNDYFLSPMTKEEYREFQNSQEQFRNEIPRVFSRQQSRDDDVGISFRAEPTKPVFQATYV